MIVPHVHQAIAQVRELQQRLLETQRFRGYSGAARAIAGSLALVCAIVMGLPGFPRDPWTHLVGWGLAAFLAALVNYGAVAYWFLYDERANRDARRLRPTLEVIPAIFVGGILTLVLVREEDFNSLFGMWMCLFGLANVASRQVLPKWVMPLGWFYIACGTVCLILQSRFTNPWPMGIVFFLGEWAGGAILRSDQPAAHCAERSALARFSGRRAAAETEEAEADEDEADEEEEATRDPVAADKHSIS